MMIKKIQEKSIHPSIDNKPIRSADDLLRLLSHWYWFLLSLLLMLTGAWLFLRYQDPVYNVTSTLMIASSDGSGSGGAGVSAALQGQAAALPTDLGNLLNVKRSVYDEQLVLKTTDLMEKAIRKLNLNIRYYRKGLFGSVEVYDRSPICFIPLSEKEDFPEIVLSVDVLPNGKLSVLMKKGPQQGSQWKLTLGGILQTASGNFKIIRSSGKGAFESPEGNYKIEISPVNQTVSATEAALDVELVNKQSDAVSLIYKTSCPDKGIKLLAQLLEEYNTSSIQEKNAFADSTIKFIDTRLSLVSNELDYVEGNIQKFKETNKIADLATQSQMVISSGADLQQKFTDLEVKQQVAQTMLTYLNDYRNQKRPVPSLITSPDPTFMALLEKYNSLQMEREQLSVGATSSNPLMVNIDKSIALARKDLIHSLENIMKIIVISQNKLNAQNTIQNGFIRSVPAKEKRFLDLSRKQELKQALYQYLLQKREEMGLTKASNLSGARIIDAPRADMFPFSPNQKLYYFIAVILGLLLPYLIDRLFQRFNRRISHVEEIVLGHDCPIIGRIPLEKSAQRLAGSQNDLHSYMVEQFRSMRTNIQFMLGSKTPAVIAVTSCISGEGKSYVSRQITEVLSSLGGRVILLNLDLRKKEKLFDNNFSNGFSSYLASNLDIKDIITTTDNPALDYIDSGPIPPNPSELLQHEKVHILLGYLREHYDYIVIDTPPVGLVSDALFISQFSDLSLYVIRLDYSYKNTLELIDELCDSEKMKNTAIVVNGLQPKSVFGVGYGYGYYGYNRNTVGTKNKFISRLKKIISRRK